MTIEGVPVITVDGPSGVGKGTVSKYLADSLAWHYLDSGALYRIVGYAANQTGVDLDAGDQLVNLIESSKIEFNNGAHLNHKRIEGEIRTEIAGEYASRVAKHPEVRSAMLALQHSFLQTPGLVADGRDMGTTIFPHAGYKFFLNADPKERAKRRCKQLMDKGLDGNIAALFQDIQRRDERDMNRSDSPLRPADDAILIDTTTLCIDQVLEKVIERLPFYNR